MIIKPKVQDLNYIKENYSDLFASVNNSLPDVGDKDKGKIFDLIMSYVTHSGGDDSIFHDPLDIETIFINDDFDDEL